MPQTISNIMLTLELQKKMLIFKFNNRFFVLSFLSLSCLLQVYHFVMSALSKKMRRSVEIEHY